MFVRTTYNMREHAKAWTWRLLNTHVISNPIFRLGQLDPFISSPSSPSSSSTVLLLYTFRFLPFSPATRGNLARIWSVGRPLNPCIRGIIANHAADYSLRAKRGVLGLQHNIPIMSDLEDSSRSHSNFTTLVQMHCFDGPETVRPYPIRRARNE